MYCAHKEMGEAERWLRQAGFDGNRPLRALPCSTAKPGSVGQNSALLEYSPMELAAYVGDVSTIRRYCVGVCSTHLQYVFQCKYCKPSIFTSAMY